LREICIDHKDPEHVTYRTECDGEPTRFEILVKKRGRPINWTSHRCKPAYSGRQSIKPKVLNDLKWYVEKNIIPAAHLDFYNSLFETDPVAEEVMVEDGDDEDDIPQEVHVENIAEILVERENEEEADDPMEVEQENLLVIPDNNDDDASTDSEH